MDEKLPWVNVLGLRLHAVNMAQTLARIDRWIQRREPHYVCLAPVHNIMDCYRDPDLRRVFNASGLTVPDGMPLVWILRRKGFRHVGRVYGPDLMLALCEHSAARGYRHFFYGGREGLPERLAAALRRRFPGLQVAGTISPPFRELTPAEDEADVERINAARPDVLWVGLGAPKQERWMGQHHGRVEVPVMIGVGAAFDYLAGVKRQAPLCMQRSGLEWVFRLLMEPRRLWKRYLVNNPWFLILLILQATGLCKFAVE
jgi:N-acetylglucosaminyldiphosphoundecaprenol N-acetyl-beta-D-mannosaminyltransferase